MNKETIFVDIDETTARTIEDGVYPVVNSEYGTGFSHDTTFNYRDVFGDRIHMDGTPISLQRKIEIFSQAILNDRGRNLIRPVVGSVEKILELSMAFNVGMLTARHVMLTEYTPEWVKHYYGESVGKVLFSNCYHGRKMGKADICKNESVKVMIEDDMDYALELANEGVLVFLLRKPWNNHRKERHRNIKIIDSWKEVNI